MLEKLQILNTLEANNFEELVSEFDCGDGDLNEFLTELVIPYHEHGLTFSYLVFNETVSAGNLVAYFSLSSDSIRLTGVDLTDLGLPFDAPLSFFPAVKLTKLAVHIAHQSSGIGGHLIKIIEGMIYTTHAAVRLLTVNSVNDPRAVAFYEKNNFITPIPQGHKQKQSDTILMYKDIYAP